jgi:hypothetical protein
VANAEQELVGEVFEVEQEGDTLIVVPARPRLADLLIETGGAESGQGWSGVVWVRFLSGGTHRLVVLPVFIHTTPERCAGPPPAGGVKQ